MMTSPRQQRLFQFACCCALAGFAAGWQARQPIKRLYVEPFVTKAGGEELRADVIAELRRMSSVSLVSGEAGADAILGGGGEIWIKGYRYRGLYPRSGPMASAGTPIYAGYLSVELRDPRGATIWSYLATPGPAAADVSRDLSRRIARHLAEALEQGEAPSARIERRPSA